MWVCLSVVFFPVKRILLQKWDTPSFLEESRRKHSCEKKRDFYHRHHQWWWYTRRARIVKDILIVSALLNKERRNNIRYISSVKRKGAKSRKNSPLFSAFDEKSVSSLFCSKSCGHSRAVNAKKRMMMINLSFFLSCVFFCSLLKKRAGFRV